jgi:hypothetical protein
MKTRSNQTRRLRFSKFLPKRQGILPMVEDLLQHRHHNALKVPLLKQQQQGILALIQLSLKHYPRTFVKRSLLPSAKQARGKGPHRLRGKHSK